MYYATIRDATRFAYLAGPYRTHGAALAAVEPCRKIAQELSPSQAHWCSFGTARVLTPQKRGAIGSGMYNERITITDRLP